MNWLKMIATIITGIILGLIVCCLIVEHDPAYKKIIEQAIVQGFSRSFGCSFKGELAACHLLFPQLVLHNVTAQSIAPEQWSWHADRVVVRFSWLDYLIRSSVKLRLVLHGVHVDSLLSGDSVHLMYHIKRLLTPKLGGNIGLETLAIEGGSASFYDDARTISYTTRFALDAVQSSSFRSMIIFKQGSLTYHNCLIMDQMKARIAILFSKEHGTRIEGQATVHGFDEHYYTVKGSYNKEKRFLEILNNAGRMLTLAGEYEPEKDCWKLNSTLACSMPTIQQWYDRIGQKGVVCPLDQGIVEGSLQGHYVGNGNHEFFATVALSKSQYHGFPLELTTTLTCTNYQLSAHHELSLDTCQIHGDTTIDTHQKTIRTHMQLTSELNTRFISVPAHSLTAMVTYNYATQQGSYAMTLALPVLKKPCTMQATFSCKDNHPYKLEGVSDTYRYMLEFDRAQSQGHGWVWESEDEQHVARARFSASSLLLKLEPLLVQKIVSMVTDHTTGGKKPCLLLLEKKDDQYILKLQHEDIGIRIGKTYNLLQKIVAEGIFNPTNRTLYAQATLLFEKGLITVKKALCRFDPDYHLHSVNIPTTFSRLFINQEKDFFGEITGFIRGEYHGGQPLLTGFLLVDKAQLRKNVFSSQVQKSMMHSWLLPYCNKDCTIDLALHTTTPAAVKTSLLDTKGHINVHVNGSLQNPLLVGTIGLQGGTLKFPYKSLTIMNGKIDFLPYRHNDPFIELTAKNRIRKYHITMRIDGTAQQPRIHFDSMPSLTEEQIITLLMSGNEEGSLSLIMPSLVMPELKKIIFGSEQPQWHINHYFRELIAPLKNIRIVPAFSDQTARGGFRGSIIVDVNDQLHGVIQKNFSLPEDTRFEVEYMVTDDVTLRAIKDERGDLGGECEVRWKF